MDEQKKKKILIVEDEVVLAATLADNLFHAGFEAIVAKDGEEGLEAALRVKPDLILLDILMPKMDGVTMLKQLRQSEKEKPIPVIILTNLGSFEDISKAVEIMDGPKEYLVKVNWRIEDVIKKVRDRLEVK